MVSTPTPAPSVNPTPAPAVDFGSAPPAFGDVPVVDDPDRPLRRVKK